MFLVEPIGTDNVLLVVYFVLKVTTTFIKINVLFFNPVCLSLILITVLY